jgi:hypothetical protein
MSMRASARPWRTLNASPSVRADRRRESPPHSGRVAPRPGATPHVEAHLLRSNNNPNKRMPITTPS